MTSYRPVPVLPLIAKTTPFAAPWRRAATALAVLAAALVFAGWNATEAQAERCLSAGSLEGNFAIGPVNRAVAANPAPFNGPFWNYVVNNCAGNHTNGASATPFGPASLHPTQCKRSFSSTSNTANFIAAWPSEAARLAAGTAAGCSFMCGGITCQVNGATGLPVELLQFGVE